MQITVKNANLSHLIYIYMYLPHLNVCYMFEILKIQDIQNQILKIGEVEEE